MSEKKVVKCKCGADVTVEGRTTHYYLPVNKKLLGVIETYRIPFVCGLCGSIDMPYRPIRAVVFLWIPTAPEKIGSIIIPDFEGRQGNARELMRDPVGIILAFGPGAYTPEGKFIPSEGLVVGDMVLYNKEVPWHQMMTDPTGKEHKVVLCSYADVIGVVKNPKSLAKLQNKEELK